MYWLPELERDPSIAMPESKFGEYVQTILGLRERYPEITVKLGVEADYVPGYEQGLLRTLGDYPWDYVYGSVHYIGDWGFDNPEYAARYSEWDIEQLYGTYFELICGAVQTGLFDIIGHLDVIKKWGHKPDKEPVKLYERVAKVIASHNIAVEVNTAGYRKPVGEPYPSKSLLAALVARGVELTLGSDAHAPEEVGKDFDRAVEELRAAGVRSLARFDRRHQERYKLDAS